MDFYSMPESARFKIYGGIDALGCLTVGGNDNKFTVAVAKGKFGALIEFMQKLGFKHDQLVYFPLGSDNPPAHLKHDGQGGIKDCNWLYATFIVPEYASV